MLREVDLNKNLTKKEYKEMMDKLAPKFAALQREARAKGLPVMVVFEGWGASGKGTMISRLIQPLDPRGFKVFTIQAENEEEHMHPFLWRFWTKTPAKGRMHIFDRSWYRRVITEQMDAPMDQKRLDAAYQQILSFEEQLSADGTLALAHNGNLVNTPELKWELIQNGAIFHTTTDSEVIAFHIARERVHSKTVEEAVLKTAKKIKGAYGLVVMSPRKLIAVRDPYGLKPLCLGKRGNAYVIASESCALTSVSAEFIRDIEPGEILTITKDGLKSNKELASAAAKRAHCVFEYIYFARLDSTIDGVKVYDARIRGGKSLAKSYPVEADLVTGVPESGLPAAKGYSEASGIPFAFAFYKNSYIGRTFIKPTQEERESSVHLKLSVLESVVKDKRIVLVDDSIVRGTTIANLIHMLKEAGAKEVHVRISSPPFLHPCYFGTDVPSNDQLIAASHSTEEICKMIGADSLGYMQTDYLEGMAGGLPLCKACFDGNYPMEIPDYTNAEFADIVKC